MSWLTDLLKEYPAVAVAKERLELEERLHEETKAKNASLQLEVDELTKEVARLKQELSELRAIRGQSRPGRPGWSPTQGRVRR